MNTLSDWELIRVFAEKQSNEAFAELVRRHLGLVYASALRQVRSPDLASDVAQAVFLLLARKAPTLPSKVVLSGWLFRSTRYIAACVIREESRRHRREQEAAEMNVQSSPSENELWRAVEPHLDDALAALGEKDRQAVLLRFLEGKRIREVGELLGLGEEAAKKRVNRAIDKLRAALGRRGVAVPALTLAGVLVGTQAQAAPAGLAQTLAAASATMVAKPSIAILIAGGARAWLWHQARIALSWSAAAVTTVALLGGSLWIASDQAKALPMTGTPAQAGSVSTSDLAPQTSNIQSSPLPAHRASASDSGRKILLSVRDQAKDGPLAGVSAVLLDATRRSTIRVSATTGPDGTCELAVPAERWGMLMVYISASNYVPLALAWQPHELTENTTLYTTHLIHGTTFQGMIVDEDGHPIPDTRIEFGIGGMDGTRRENVMCPSSLSTDSEGHFRCDQMPPDFGINQFDVKFYHSNYVSAEFDIIKPAEVATNWTVTLLRGVTVHGHIFNPQGAPIGNAKLEEGSPNSGGKVVRTSPDGSFEISNVGPGTHEWAVGAKGYAGLQLNIQGIMNGPEINLTLREKKQLPPPPAPVRVHFTGTVKDAETGEPVSRFKVIKIEGGTIPRLLGEGVNGQFDWYAELDRRSDFSLEVEADGYLPAGSGSRSNSVDPQTYAFKLTRGADLTGVILQPDGQPAAGAIVGLSKADEFRQRPHLHDNGDLTSFARSDARVVADASGRFTIRRQLKVDQMLVAHKSGFAMVPSATVTNINIPLQPWGRIEGRFLVGTQPLAGQTIWLDSPRATINQQAFEIYSRQTTDAQGRFLFTNVPPGNFEVRRWFSPHPGRAADTGLTQARNVSMHPGETVKVTIGGEGRAVVGKLMLSEPVADYDWTTDLQALVLPRPDLPAPRPQDFKDRRDYLYALHFNYEEQITRYFLVVQSDGYFRVDDVPPGTYELQLQATRAPIGYDVTETGWREWTTLGTFNSTVTIPAADSDTTEPVDLGTITIPVKAAANP